MSGKTLTQLSDESGLTVDTINNLFYARIQKPGLIGVAALVKAMGFSVQDLMAFMERHESLPENADVTELFAQYINSVSDTGAPVPPANAPVAVSAPGTAASVPEKTAAQIDLLNAEHEKQLDRFKATHLGYVEQLNAQHRDQIEQMKESSRQLEQHFEHSVAELKAIHEQELARVDADLKQTKRVNHIIGIALAIETAFVVLLAVIDSLNAGIGWFR